MIRKNYCHILPARETCGRELGPKTTRQLRYKFSPDARVTVLKRMQLTSPRLGMNNLFTAVFR